MYSGLLRLGALAEVKYIIIIIYIYIMNIIMIIMMIIIICIHIYTYIYIYRERERERESLVKSGILFSGNVCMQEFKAPGSGINYKI